MYYIRYNCITTRRYETRIVVDATLNTITTQHVRNEITKQHYYANFINTIVKQK